MKSEPPIFKVVAAALKAQIVARELPPGGVLPSENELCSRYNISRPSVRKALELLESEGLIFRQPGVGTFVRAEQHGPADPGLNIAVSLTDPGNWYGTEIYDSVHKCCAEINARPIIAATGDIIAGRAGKIDAYLLLPRYEGHSELEALNQISGAGTPVAILNRFSDLTNLAYFAVDYELESKRAVDLLRRFGHRRIGLVASKIFSAYAAQTRAAGYRRSCAEGELTALECWVDNGIECVDQIEPFLRENRPDALFLTTRDLLDYSLFACRHLQLTVGRDLAIFCFDNLNLSGRDPYPVMYAQMPLRQMAADAVTYLAARCRRSNDVAVQRQLYNINIVLDSNLVQ